MKKKLAGLFVLILLAFVFLVIGITIINAKSGDKYTKQVLAQSQQQYDSTTIPYKRGDILDRSGNILATSINTKPRFRNSLQTCNDFFIFVCTLF